MERQQVKKMFFMLKTHTLSYQCYFTDPEDYEGAIDYILTIEPGTAVGGGVCHYFPITDDDAFEKNETFSVHISSELRVNIDEPYLTITIQDDDSKYGLGCSTRS